MKLSTYTGLSLIVALYVLCIVLANLTLDWFIELPYYGLLSIGTFFFAGIFTLRDKIHFYGGLPLVSIAIACALVVNLAVSLLLDTPARFIIASFLSIMASEIADTAVFHRLKESSFFARVLTSNAISVPLDSVLFAFLAFYGDMPLSDVWQIAYADIIVKYTVALLFLFQFKMFFEQKPLLRG